MKLRTAFSIPAQTSELNKPTPPKKDDVQKSQSSKTEHLTGPVIIDLETNGLT